MECSQRRQKRLRNFKFLMRRTRTEVLNAGTLNTIHFIFFFGLCFLLGKCTATRHVNGDKLHFYSRQLPKNVPSGQGQSLEIDSAVGDQLKTVSYRYTDDLSYEPSINPFLSHMEHGWKLQPGRYGASKKTFQQDKPTTDLPLDPNRPHFMDSNEEMEAATESNFGDEDKDLGELFQVLFSGDYNA